jgi:hypothetical protein
LRRPRGRFVLCAAGQTRCMWISQEALRRAILDKAQYNRALRDECVGAPYGKKVCPAAWRTCERAKRLKERRHRRGDAAEDLAGRGAALAAAPAAQPPGTGADDAATAIADHVRHELACRHQR